jgi:sugar O-acyltransferase (sialic acid O-acetyltransferase NeuD family)
MARIAIIGGGALAREVHSWLLAMKQAGAEIDLAGYADDSGPSMEGFAGIDLPYLGPIQALAVDGLELAMAIGSPAAKASIAKALRAKGARFATIVHPSAVVTPTAMLGEGVVIGPLAYIASHARIEELVIVNALSGIGHDTVIGACTTISAQVDITGGGVVGREAFFGTGARSLPNVVIGAGAKIGAGAVVVRRVKPGQTMFAAPAKAFGGQ